MTTTRTISHYQLIELLKTLKHAMPLTFSALTEPKARINPWGTIYKLSRVNAFTGADYERAVNRAIEKRTGQPSSFEAGARQWGTPLQGHPHLVHKSGAYYLSVHVQAARPIYLVRKPLVTTAGIEAVEMPLVPIDYSLVAPFLPPSRTAPGGVVRRDYSIANIVSLAAMGGNWRVRHD